MSDSPTIDAMLTACNNDFPRFLLECKRQRGSLTSEVRTGLTLSSNQSPRLHRTLRAICEEAYGPDPRWVRTSAGLLACFDAYVTYLDEMYYPERNHSLLCDEQPNLLNATDARHSRESLTWLRDNMSPVTVTTTEGN